MDYFSILLVVAIVLAVGIVSFYIGYRMSQGEAAHLRRMLEQERLLRERPEPLPEKPVLMLECLKDWNRLWGAICQVESGNNPDAFNEKEDAAGIAQIRPICVEDCNRILGYKRWSLADRYSTTQSYHMFRVYMDEYFIPLNMTMENVARMWPGGPDGWKEDCTLPYWEKVKGVLETQG